MKKCFLMLAAALLVVTFSACNRSEKATETPVQEEMSKTESGEKPIVFDEDPEQKQGERIVIQKQEDLPEQKQEQKQSQKQQLQK